MGSIAFLFYQIFILFRVRIGKAAGPDAMCGRTLHYCADQLSEVFSFHFQMCAGNGQIPTLWNMASIIPNLKSKNPKNLVNCDQLL